MMTVTISIMTFSHIYRAAKINDSVNPNVKRGFSVIKIFYC